MVNHYCTVAKKATWICPNPGVEFGFIIPNSTFKIRAIPAKILRKFPASFSILLKYWCTFPKAIAYPYINMVLN